MVAICKTTGMVITYFTQMTWLALRYNLEVKTIRSDNEMNRIKTRDWCTNVGISFEPRAQ